MPQTGQIVLLALMGVPAALSMLWAVADSRNRRDPLPLMILFGAALTVMYEGLGGSLLGLVYPSEDQITLVSTFGMDVPVFMGLLHLWFVPMAAYWAISRAVWGVEQLEFWSWWVCITVAAVLFTSSASWLLGDVWLFTGDHVLRIGEVPLVVPIAAVSTCFGVAAGVTLIERNLPRAQIWLAVPVVAMLAAACHVATIMPYAFALDATDNDLLLMVGALLSLLFCIAMSHLASHVMREPWIRHIDQPHALDRSIEITKKNCTGVIATVPRRTLGLASTY